MARILLIIAGLLVLGAAGGFVWAGMFPPAAQSAAVTHDLSVSQVAGQ
jgi:hypothetical protein